MHRGIAALAFSLAGLALSGSPTPDRFIPAGDGVQLWLAEAGRGPAVVVVHGGPGMDHASLSADLAPLEKRHRVIYYDQRGGGRSTLPADPALLTLEHHVDDLEALRRHLGLEKLTLLAHSFGPAVAARYAIRHPSRVERMVFLGPIPPRKGPFFEQYGQTLMKRVSESDRARAEELQKGMTSDDDATVVSSCRDYWKIMTPPRVAQSLPVAVVHSDLCTASGAAIRYGTTKTQSGTWGSMGDWDWTAELSRVQAPVLVVHGEEDAIPMALVSEWVTALPHARILRLKETGHFPHAERPAIVFPAIESFLRGRWPKGAGSR